MGFGRGTLSRSLRPLGADLSCEEGNDGPFGTGCWQGDLDAGVHFREPGGELDQAEPDGVELSGAPQGFSRRPLAQPMHQPVDRRVQDQAELIGGGLVA